MGGFSGVTAVVVTYESESVVVRCLEALAEADARTVLVDNASSDATVAVVRNLFPDVVVRSHEANVGYAAAANAGVAIVESPFMLLVNPDAWPTPGAVGRLTAAAESDSSVAVVVPRLLDEAGRQQPSRVGYPTEYWIGTPAVSAFAGRRAGGREHGFGVGAALLVRTEAFREVGGFDPSFFLYYEEVDLCWRLERAGWRIVSCADAAFVHLGGASTRLDWQRSYRRQLEGHLRFIRKHRGRAAAERARRILVGAAWVRGVVGPPESREAARMASAWLRRGPVDELLDGVSGA